MLLTALEDNLVEHSFLRILLYELRFWHVIIYFFSLSRCTTEVDLHLTDTSRWVISRNIWYWIKAVCKFSFVKSRIRTKLSISKTNWTLPFSAAFARVEAIRSFLSQEMVDWRWNRPRSWICTQSQRLSFALCGSPWIRSSIYNSVVRHHYSGGASYNHSNHFSTYLFPHSGMGLHSHW